MRGLATVGQIGVEGGQGQVGLVGVAALLVAALVEARSPIIAKILYRSLQLLLRVLGKAGRRQL